ncbi:MAG TPA: ABC transporter permease [Acidimicrobiales bacterium]|nr:ABC transporter permease [Acidimicrobiales bacterium]
MGAGPLLQWSWVSQQSSQILSLLLQHVELTLLAVGFGLAISVPVGVGAHRYVALRPPVMGFAGALYVVPSVALLSLAAPITGFFTVTTAEVALVSYTLLILIRNIVAGLDSVPPHVVDAARAMGYSRLQLLVRVQLPMALPSLIAGIRVATVTTIGLVNVTAFVGQGGLGQLIIQGFQDNFGTPVVVALLASVLLAGIADLLIAGMGRLLTPWAR